MNKYQKGSLCCANCIVTDLMTQIPQHITLSHCTWKFPAVKPRLAV